MATPRIIYNSITVDFDRRLNIFNPLKRQYAVINDNPTTGFRERLNFFSQSELVISRRFASAGLRHQLQAVWDYLAEGNSCAFWHDPDLKGAWNFEGGTLNDIDGNAPITTSGTMAYPAAKYGLGLNITNQTVYYDVDDYFADPPPKGTIAFWFAPNFVVSSNAANHTLFQIDSASGDATASCLWTSANFFAFILRAAASSPIQIGIDLSALLQNVFHHFAVTWDSTIANGGKFYLDGVLVSTSTNSSFTVKSTGTNFRLGYDGTDYANGIFDDLVIRSDVLSAYDIAQLVTTAYWPMRNYWPALMTEDDHFICEPVVNTPYYSIEMNFKEVL